MVIINIITNAPKDWRERKIGGKYIHEGVVQIWGADKRWKCRHNSRKQTCTTCGTGSYICVHKRRKNACGQCKSSQNYCIHNKYRPWCEICNPNRYYCQHGTKKYVCKLCPGKGICIHGERKSRCATCGGRELCKCGKILYFCKECSGTTGNYCIHGKQKHYCKDCGGKAYCSCGKRREICRKCGYDDYPEKWCENCTYVLISNADYAPLCFSCYCFLNPDLEIAGRYMMKENYMNDFLKINLVNIELIHNKKIDEGCSGRKPDWFLDLITHSIIIECDENEHNNYICENARTVQLLEDLAFRPLIMIRFNPDSYIKDSKDINGCFEYDEKNRIITNEDEWNKRSKILLEYILKFINIIPENSLTIIKLFYSDNLELNPDFPEICIN